MLGTGFFIEESGVVVTNYHLLMDAVNVMVASFDRQVYKLNKILVSSEKYDFVKFSINNPDNKKFQILHPARTIPLKGEDIFVVGNPEGLEFTVSKGIVSAIREISDYGNIYQITAPISMGSSGSPVMNLNGEVIGIVSFQAKEGQNLNFAIEVGIIDKISSNDLEFPEKPPNISEVGQSEQGKTKKQPINFPEDKEASIILLDSLIQDWDSSAFKLVNIFILRYPQSYEGYIKRAQNYLSPGFYNLPETWDSTSQIKYFKLAIKDYDKAVYLAPNVAEVYLARASGKLRFVNWGFIKIPGFVNWGSIKIPGWDIQGGLADIEKCKSIDDQFKKDKRLSLESKLLFLKDDYKKALLAYNDLIEFYDVEQLLREVSEKKVEAIQIYFRGQAYYDRALTKLQLADTLGSLQDVETAIKIGHKSSLCEYYNLHKEIQLKLKEYSSALSDLNYLLEKRCNYGQRMFIEACYEKAYILFKIDGDLVDALNCITEGIHWAEIYGPSVCTNEALVSYYHLKYIFDEKLKKFEMALMDINKVIDIVSIDPKNQELASYYDSRSGIKSKMGDQLGALKDINKAIEMDSKDSYYYGQKAYILSDLNDYDGALSAINRALELSPKKGEYYIQRAFIKYPVNKNEACSDWSKAGELGAFKAYDYLRQFCK
jgi:tetratricopeptide (TPR) repeat protein